MSHVPAQAMFPNPIEPSFVELLDEDFVEYYNEYLAVKPATHGVAIEEIRAAPHKFASPWCRDYSSEPFVSDVRIKSDDGHEFTTRCYSPDPQTSPFGAGPYPIHINFHGGGYVLGGLTGDAEICMLLRNRVGIMVMDIDYRLCPEHTFLKGHEDAWSAIRWVHEHGQEINARPNSISIGGISAGGHIGAVAQQLARDANVNLKLAILAVPATTCHLDMRKASDSPFSSFVENEVAPCLNWARMAYFMSHAAPENDRQRAEIQHKPLFHRSPIDGDLRGLCDTFVATAECDPLRDEGEAYGERLVRAGVRVTMRRYTGVPHPFMHMMPVKKAQMYADGICSELRRVHEASRSVGVDETS